MNYPCDQIDCIIHPVYIEGEEKKKREKAQQIQPTNNDDIYLRSVTCETIGKLHSYVNIPCLDKNIAFECFLCQYLKRQDIKTNLIVYNAKNVLNE